jgi:hypothetical protein
LILIALYTFWRIKLNTSLKQLDTCIMFASLLALM